MRAWWWVVVLAGCKSSTPGDVFPDAAPDGRPPCDIVDQDCFLIRDGLKCTLTASPLNDGFPGCVPAGPVSIGGACAGSFGQDNCAARGVCTPAGVVPPASGGTSYCRTLCTADAQCPLGERCRNAVEGLGIDPPLGYCAPTCVPFTPCPSGMTCSDHRADVAGPADVIFSCRVAGEAPVLGSCSEDKDCVGDAVCLGRCRALCDATHPCTAGQSCRMMFGTAGFCL